MTDDRAISCRRSTMRSKLVAVVEMARGWESKSVEAQIDSARTASPEDGKRQVTPEAAALIRKRETLLLARAHLQQQIQASQHPRHRTMLETALGDLEKQIAGLGSTSL